MKAGSNHSVIRLGGKNPVVQCDHMSALVASVARLLGVFMAVPIQGEHVLPGFRRSGPQICMGRGNPASGRRSCMPVRNPELQPVQRSRSCPSYRAWSYEKSNAKSKKVARYFEFVWCRLAALRDSRTTFAIIKK